MATAATVYGGPLTTANVGSYRKKTDLEGKRQKSRRRTRKERIRFNKGKYVHIGD